MQAQQISKNEHYTFDEYIQMEQESPVRHEYYYGEVFARAGASLNHNEITSNINGFKKAYLNQKVAAPFRKVQSWK